LPNTRKTLCALLATAFLGTLVPFNTVFGIVLVNSVLTVKRAARCGK
jgi:hypothetical protein